MVVGIIAPCMLGAMGVIFVGFLAPAATVVGAQMQNEEDDKVRREEANKSL
eukprot:CAMPEP_0114113556 /NCGR_PEP_ID=MMETSP0043_2-20121206/2977_1 /TAXON_ID=464988 /ORGANISM="Hemiselmis andersenii, Strain CCMP644" /LENGTH=50 /DNA_ID=CAMNT_0001205717 /DNA_START=23 /DNA_END=175 /DNA_ORIENTATION=-